MQKLIICEKNISARRIAYILSNGKAQKNQIEGVPYYSFDDINVVGLRGHIKKLDFPSEYKSWNYTSPKNLIDINPIKQIVEKRHANTIKKLSHNSNEVIIATDYDREGELIGTEVLDLLHPSAIIKRAHFSSITPNEIKKSFANLSEVNHNLAKAAEARQYIDLIWGASLTRFMSLTSGQLGKDFLSVGRVQSPTLSLIVNLEKEINNFIPIDYWIIQAYFEKNGEKFKAEYPEKIKDESIANNIIENIKKAEYGKVKSFEKEHKQNWPPHPFDTTTFLKEAGKIGFSASQAMRIAEELYINGLISYPRTDNTVYPPLPFKNILEKLEKLYPSEVKTVRTIFRGKPVSGKKSSTDHPPIYPVNIGKMEGQHKKIFDLIARRFMATLCKNALLEIRRFVIEINKIPFKSDGTIVLEKNWRLIYPVKTIETAIPDLSEGESVKIIKRKKSKKTTKPPQRYTQGGLIVQMEKLGLGTKSTRHEIINKLINRSYISGHSLVPTKTAFAVIESLEKSANIITKHDMTSRLEAEMTQIAEGLITFEKVLAESKKYLLSAFNDLENNKDIIKKTIEDAITNQKNYGKCARCGHMLTLKTSAKGKRFIGCTHYPACTNSYPLPQKGYVEYAKENCDKCGAPLANLSYGRKKQKMCINMNCN